MTRGRLTVHSGHPADQVLRLAAFRAAYPDVLVEPIRGKLLWQARITEVNGETIITRYELRDLLDKLDEIFTGTPPGGAADRPSGALRMPLRAPGAAPCRA